MGSSEVVMGFLKAMEAMDYEAAMPFLDEDIRYINGPTPEVTGPAAVRGVLEPFFAPIEENIFEVARSIESGNTVFVERLDKHRIPQGWFELPVTGVFEVEDGKITYWHEYFDLATIVDQMTRLTTQT